MPLSGRFFEESTVERPDQACDSISLRCAGRSSLARLYHSLSLSSEKVSYGGHKVSLLFHFFLHFLTIIPKVFS